MDRNGNSKTCFLIVIWIAIMALLIGMIILFTCRGIDRSVLLTVCRLLLAFVLLPGLIAFFIFLFRKTRLREYSWWHGFGKYDSKKKDED